jgi:polyisoprenoid-binding protein YceI
MTRRSQTLLLPLALLSLAPLGACKNPADDAPKAQVAQGAQPKQAEAPQAGHEALPISPEQSKVLFTGAKVTGKHEGGFTKFSGTIHLDPERVEASRVEVDIDMASLFTDSERLTGHLKSGDFFLVEQHPTARFVSTQVVPGGEGGATHTLTGNLTLRGVTKTVTFPATVHVGPEAVHAKASFALPRKQFGVAYEGKPDDLIRDDVLMTLDVTAPRKGATAGAQ